MRAVRQSNNFDANCIYRLMGVIECDGVTIFFCLRKFRVESRAITYFNIAIGQQRSFSCTVVGVHVCVRARRNKINVPEYKSTHSHILTAVRVCLTPPVRYIRHNEHVRRPIINTYTDVA